MKRGLRQTPAPSPSPFGAAELSELATPSPDGPEDEDAALIARTARRDKAAFVLLFERWAGRVKAFLIRGGLTSPEADEAAQDVMLSVWRRAESFDPAKAGAATWIYTIARNRRIDQLRRRRPEPDPQDPLFRADPEPDGEDVSSRAARDKRLREALASLSPEQAEVVRLAFFEGLSHLEIAERLGAPVGTVKGRMRLAFGRLKTALGVEFHEELRDG